MNTTKKTRLACILAVTLGGVASVSASTVPLLPPLTSATYPTGERLAVSLNDWNASRFSTGTSACIGGCYLSDITLAIHATEDDLFNPNLTLEVVSDSLGGTLPGDSTVATYNNTLTEILGGVGSGNHTFTPTSTTVLLENDTNYWVKLTKDPSAETEVAWENHPDSEGNFAWSFSPSLAPFTGEGNNFLMQVEVTPVPIPAAFWLMGTALAGLAARAKRHASRS